MGYVEGKKLVAKYRNGNVDVSLYEDGTKIRRTEDDEFLPEFAECMDVTISTRCSHGCQFCYANCTPEGKVANLLENKILDTIPPGTEIAININSEFIPNFDKFLKKMTEQRVFVNATIRQDDFEENYSKIRKYCKDGLLHGVGISLIKPTPLFIWRAKAIPNSVIHVINGIVTKEQLDAMSGLGMKLLILGYKNRGRGVEYQKAQVRAIKANYNWLKENLKDYIPRFQVVSFDNLSLDQLNVKRFLTPAEWAKFYQGDEGSSTFFLNLAEGYFARDSLTSRHYDLLSDVKDMFKVIQREVEDDKRKENKLSEDKRDVDRRIG